jgi:hypothetical protein
MKLKLKSYVNVQRPLDDLILSTIKVLLTIWGLVLLASTTWKVILPRPLPPMPQLEALKNDLRENILASHWFGNSSSPAVIATTVVNFKLMGVFSQPLRNLVLQFLKWRMVNSA